MYSNNFQFLLNSANQYYKQNKQNIDHIYIKKILKESVNYTVISFDIFDTLLTRLFECPIDLFAYVENQLQETNNTIAEFAKHRLQAEAQIRNIVYEQETRDEVTLEEIYQYMLNYINEDECLLEKAKKLELLAELSSNICIEDNKKLILDLKKQGKKIIFVSDIYLSKNFIEQLLDKHGLKIYDELYVSSDLMSSKHSGKIWNYVKKNNSNSKILHIGDNIFSDVKQPKNSNIDTYHYSRFCGERRIGAQLCPNVVPFSLMNKLFHLTNGKYSLNDFNEEKFWVGLGETLGALILYSFALWIKEQIIKNKIEHIYFCARDAQIIEKVWQLLECNKECNTTSNYLYLSRMSLRFPTYYIEIEENGKLSEASLNFIVNESTVANDTYKTYFNRLGIKESHLVDTKFIQRFGSLENSFDFAKTEEIKSFIQQELTYKLLEVFEEKYSNAMEYYSQEGLFNNEKKIAIIDLGWNGTIQLALTEFRKHKGVHNKLYGFYYGLFNDTATGRLYKNGPMKSAFFNIFLGNNEKKLIQNCINILENLHSADHETTIGFTENLKNNLFIPILKENVDSLYLKQYLEKISLFQKGALQSILKWKNNETIYCLDNNWIDVEYAKAAIFQVCISPNKYEQKYLGNIQHSTLFDHQSMVPLINQKLPNNLNEVMPLFSSGGWECGVIQYWKKNRKEIKPHIYKAALQYFNDFPILIKNFIEN